MKLKKVIIITLAMTINATVMAQMKFGVKAGLNVSGLSGSDYEVYGRNSIEEGYTLTTGTMENSKMIAGFHIGVSANYAFNNFWGVQSEALFSRQGGKIKYPSSLEKVTHLNYINVPLLADIKPIKQLPLSILAGPQLGVCLGRTSVMSI